MSSYSELKDQYHNLKRQSNLKSDFLLQRSALSRQQTDQWKQEEIAIFSAAMRCHIQGARENVDIQSDYIEFLERTTLPSEFQNNNFQRNHIKGTYEFIFKSKAIMRLMPAWLQALDHQNLIPDLLEKIEAENTAIPVAIQNKIKTFWNEKQKSKELIESLRKELATLYENAETNRTQGKFLVQHAQETRRSDYAELTKQLNKSNEQALIITIKIILAGYIGNDKSIEEECKDLVDGVLVKESKHTFKKVFSQFNSAQITNLFSALSNYNLLMPFMYQANEIPEHLSDTPTDLEQLIEYENSALPLNLRYAYRAFLKNTQSQIILVRSKDHQVLNDKRQNFNNYMKAPEGNEKIVIDEAIIKKAVDIVLLAKRIHSIDGEDCKWLTIIVDIMSDPLNPKAQKDLKEIFKEYEKEDFFDLFESLNNFSNVPNLLYTGEVFIDSKQIKFSPITYDNKGILPYDRISATTLLNIEDENSKISFPFMLLERHKKTSLPESFYDAFYEWASDHSVTIPDAKQSNQAFTFAPSKEVINNQTLSIEDKEREKQEAAPETSNGDKTLAQAGEKLGESEKLVSLRQKHENIDTILTRKLEQWQNNPAKKIRDIKLHADLMDRFVIQHTKSLIKILIQSASEESPLAFNDADLIFKLLSDPCVNGEIKSKRNSWNKAIKSLDPSEFDAFVAALEKFNFRVLLIDNPGIELSALSPQIAERLRNWKETNFANLLPQETADFSNKTENPSLSSNQEEFLKQISLLVAAELQSAGYDPDKFTVEREGKKIYCTDWDGTLLPLTVSLVDGKIKISKFPKFVPPLELTIQKEDFSPRDSDDLAIKNPVISLEKQISLDFDRSAAPNKPEKCDSLPDQEEFMDQMALLSGMELLRKGYNPDKFSIERRKDNRIYCTDWNEAFISVTVGLIEGKLKIYEFPKFVSPFKLKPAFELTIQEEDFSSKDSNDLVIKNPAISLEKQYLLNFEKVAAPAPDKAEDTPDIIGVTPIIGVKNLLPEGEAEDMGITSDKAREYGEAGGPRYQDRLLWIAQYLRKKDDYSIKQIYYDETLKGINGKRNTLIVLEYGIDNHHFQVAVSISIERLREKNLNFLDLLRSSNFEELKSELGNSTYIIRNPINFEESDFNDSTTIAELKKRDDVFQVSCYSPKQFLPAIRYYSYEPIENLQIQLKKPLGWGDKKMPLLETVRDFYDDTNQMYLTHDRGIIEHGPLAGKTTPARIYSAIKDRRIPGLNHITNFPELLNESLNNRDLPPRKKIEPEARIMTAQYIFNEAVLHVAYLGRCMTAEDRPDIEAALQQSLVIGLDKMGIPVGTKTTAAFNIATELGDKTEDDTLKPRSVFFAKQYAENIGLKVA